MEVYCILLHSEFLYVDRPQGSSKLREGFTKMQLAIRSLARPPVTVGRRQDGLVFPSQTRNCWKRILAAPAVRGVFCMDEALGVDLPSEKWIHLEEFGHKGVDLETGVCGPPSAGWDRLFHRVQEFLREHRGKMVVLSLGELEPRKGFDLLLQLVATNPDTVCLRIGRTKPRYRSTWAAVHAKEQLILENRLLELDLYVRDERLIQQAYSGISFMILPYRKFYRTSGIFVESLWHGKPVLAADNGVMARRIRTHSVGQTFEDDSFESLQATFPEFVGRLAEFRPHIDKYRRLLGWETLEAKLSLLVTPHGHNDGHSREN